MKTPSEYRQMEFVNVIKELAILLKPNLYVEYGIKKGYTFSRIAPLAESAIAVDINGGVAMPNNATFFQGTTNEFIDKWNGKIDMLFIDADHHADSVYSDLIKSIPFFIPGKTIIFLHDTHPVIPELLAEGYCYDAWKAAKKVRCELKEFEITTFPGPWAGLSVLRYLGPEGFHGWMDKEAIR